MRSSENKVLPASDYYIHIASAQAKKVFFYPTFVGYFFYDKGYRLSRLTYDSFLLIYIRKGSMYFDMNNKTIKASENQIVLLDCFAYHAYYTTEVCEAEWMHFDGPMARQYYNMIIEKNGNVITLRQSYRFQKNLHEAYMQLKQNNILKEAKVTEAITIMLTELLVSQEINEKQECLNGKMDEVVTYILDHFTEDLTLEDMAEKANLSPYYFTRVFKAVTGYTPHEFLLISRMNAAKFLLHDTSASVKETCFSVGFTNESNFCTSFKKIVGVTPSEYRNDK